MPLVVFLLALLFGLSACTPDRTQVHDPQVRIDTDLGALTVELYPEAAPISVANFLRYVDEERWEDASFYRAVRANNQPNDSVRIAVIQGGLGFGEQPQRLPAITHETTATTGLRHENGTLSMARAAPGTASSEFFICIGDQPALDYGGRRNPDGQGFAAFGRVIDGMEIVRAIQQQAADGQMLQTPIRIREIVRVGGSSADQ